MGNVQTIAIVDDDDEVRVATGSLARSLGLKTATYASAEEFLEQKGFDRADCLITDLQMPGMNGLQLQGHLVQAGIDLPLIVITAFPEDALRKTAEANGAVAFLTKPFDGNALVHYINEALSRARAREP